MHKEWCLEIFSKPEKAQDRANELEKLGYDLEPPRLQVMDGKPLILIAACKPIPPPPSETFLPSHSEEAEPPKPLPDIPRETHS